MTIVMKEIVVVAFEIFAPVGRGQTNDPDDMQTIKMLLNNITTVQGGAAGTLDENDSSKSGREFDRFVEAIEIFQDHNLKALFTPDGIVSPEKATHKKLRELFTGSRSRGVSLLQLPVLVRPVGSLSGLSNEQGFSAEGLKKGGGGEWALRDITPTPIQAIPVTETRMLVITPLPGTKIASASLSTTIDDISVAKIEGSDPKFLTIRGLSAGQTTLTIRAKGKEKKITIMVRRARSIKLHLTVIGDVLAAGEETTLQNFIIQQMNRIFQPQSNFTFTPGTPKVVKQVKRVATGTQQAIDPAQTVFLDLTNSVAPNAAQPIVVQKQDLLAIDPSIATDLRLFIGNIQEINRPTILGRAFNGIGGKVCWFGLNQLNRAKQNSFSTIAHEGGHAVGLFHVTAPNNNRFLMFPNVSPEDNSLIIPAETTVDLGAP